MKELEALAARKAALDLELEVLEQERERVRELVEARRRLPVLPNIRIAAPCPASWDAMVGDRRVRACTHCKQNVFNLSAMARADAEELIREKQGNLCARYYQRQDGTILLADCAVGIAQKKKRRVIAAGAAMLLAGSATAAWLTRHREPQYTQGSIGFEESEQEHMQMRVLANQLEPPPPPEQAPPPPHEDPEVHMTMGAVAISPDYEVHVSGSDK